jgi:preprotein translocase subunit SecG
VNTFLSIVHVTICFILILLILVQQGKGGGMGAALGGGATNQVFGGRGAGSFLTRGTGICAALFMLNCVGIAYFTSDHALQDRQAAEKKDKEKKGQSGAARPKDSAAPTASVAPIPAPVSAPVPAPTSAPAPAPSGK